MKSKLLTLLVVFPLLLMVDRASAAEASPAATELKDLITRIQTKLKEGNKTEAALAPELKTFDELLAKHKDEKTDDVAQILYMKSMVYEQVLGNHDKASELVAQLKRDFPDSNPVKMMKQQEEAEKIQASLIEGSKFPDFEEKDVAGKPLSVGNYKGKVVLVDFWATWCPPCRAELPNVIKTYENYHSKGFEIIGISLDQSEEKLTSFTKEKSMPWQQYFDGKGWGNKLAGKYGIQSIPATYLLDRAGKIIGKGLRGEDLETAVSKALAKN
jgi:thiol-disulfide isomerase/thioredoxin